MSRSNATGSPIASLDRIVELAQTLAPLLEDAADAGGRKSRGAIGEIGRGKCFTDSDPTSSMALDPTRRQMRAAVHRATTLFLRTEDELTEAGAVIANGYLRLDRDEWVRVVEKRSAALAPFPQPFPRAVSEPVPPDTMRTTRSAPPRHETEPHDTG